MVLPLYFAIFSDEFSKFQKIPHPIAAMGCTFGEEEMVWRDPFPAEMLVVDDRALPQRVSGHYAQSLLHLLGENRIERVVFDFERPYHPLCAQFLQEICALNETKIIVPPTYAESVPSALVLVSGAPCNCWAQFCAAQQEKYPDRWCLEVVPWRYRVCDGKRHPCSEDVSGRFQHKNTDALCITGQAGKDFYFFDTGRTLREKLGVAGEYSCCLAIGIGAELLPLTT